MFASSRTATDGEPHRARNGLHACRLTRYAPPPRPARFHVAASQCRQPSRTPGRHAEPPPPMSITVLTPVLYTIIVVYASHYLRARRFAATPSRRRRYYFHTKATNDDYRRKCLLPLLLEQFSCR